MTLQETLVPEAPPLREDQGGVIRVAGTRVRLDTVVFAFNNGATAEEILLRYPSLALSDIYAVIAHYLRHRAEVDAYVVERERIAEEARQESEKRFPRDGLRERLLARRAAQP